MFTIKNNKTNSASGLIVNRVKYENDSAEIMIKFQHKLKMYKIK